MHVAQVDTSNLLFGVTAFKLRLGGPGWSGLSRQESVERIQGKWRKWTNDSRISHWDSQAVCAFDI